MNKLTIQDMTTIATNSAELELIKQCGKNLAEAFRLVTGESIDNDQDLIYDLLDNQESE